ncbi:MAG TPA: hypothetical protein VI322_01765 [Candidatus Saccharimonadia bacterium]
MAQIAQPYQLPLRRRSFGEALLLYLRDANKLHLFGLGRVLLLFLAGYAPFAAINDALAPFALGIPLIDDLEVPIGIIAALKIWVDVRRYQDPAYRPRR